MRSGRENYDVVFYTPFIGKMISSRPSSPAGGAETQILMLSKALAGWGLRVAIIAYGDSSVLPEEVEGVRIIARPQYKWDKNVTDKVLEVVRIWQSLWRAPSRAVVYRSANPQLGLVALYATLSRRQLVFSVANVADCRLHQWAGDFRFHQWAPSGWHTLLYRLGVRLASEIVVQTEEQAPMCEATFRRRPRLIKSLSPLVELTSVEPEAFLWVGRLVSYKQPLAYLELARSVPEARFRMVGVLPHDDREYPLAEEVAAAAAEIPNLEVLPPRSHAQLGQLMAHAVASVNTASWEGMPNVLLEAWSRGVPALVLEYDPDGVISKHGLGGFAGGSASRFAELAREQWHSRHDRSELAQRCRAYIASHHAPDVVATQWLELLTGHPLGLGSEEPRTMGRACAESPHEWHCQRDQTASHSSGGDDHMQSVTPGLASIRVGGEHFAREI